jgi:3-oxoacyl-[acyl-carrier-protein] synthase II
VSRRVVVTGMGVVAPNGIGLDAYGASLRDGRSGIGPITLFDVSGYPTRFAGEVEAALLPPLRLPERQQGKFLTRTTRFAAAAAEMAIADAGVDLSDLPPERIGVSLGGSRGYFPGSFEKLCGKAIACEDAERPGAIALEQYLREMWECTNPLELLATFPNMPAATLATLYGARGLNRTILTTCASGTQAIGDAARYIAWDNADLILAGGADSMIHPLGMLGFNLLGALSTSADGAHASRPFDAQRNGFVMGEGAGILVLETLEHALSRGARIHAEIAGYGVASDAYRMTDEHPEGRGAIASMRRALEDAELEPAAIDYINAHGTSTPLNDKIETAAIKEVFGQDAYRVPISSTKSMIGHLVAAAGAVELIAAVLALRGGFIPPTINYEHPDPACDLDYVPNVSRTRPVSAAMSNSFGFGGQCAVLVVKKIGDQ